MPPPPAGPMLATGCASRLGAASGPPLPYPPPPALVAVYLSTLAANGLAPPSVARALAAIAHHHRQARLVPPHRADGGSVVTDVLAGIRRSRIGGPDRKAAADADVVMRLLWAIEGDGLAALRDRAVIAFGMALAARRSELVALDVADLAWEEKGFARHHPPFQDRSGRRGCYGRGARGPSAQSPCPPARLAPGRWHHRRTGVSGRCGRAAVCARSACPTMPSPASSRREPWRQGSTPRTTLGTRCGRVS